MPQLHLTQQSLRLLLLSSRQQYLCKTCRAQAIRQLHSSRIAGAEVPFFRRIQETLFGTKESKAAEAKREQKQKERIQQRQHQTDGEGLAVKQRRHGAYEIAEEVDASTHEGYTPATTWAGLERIGGEQWVKEKADQGEQYEGFIPAARLEVSDLQLTEMLRSVAVEELGPQIRGRNLMSQQLRDPKFKFTIYKRMMQLTGHRISDPIVSNSNTIGDLYSAFKKKEPPKRLADTNELLRLESKAANVNVHPRRLSYIDKEKAVGRWKIIEDELLARDLPITGDRWPRNNKHLQKTWWKEKVAHTT